MRLGLLFLISLLSLLMPALSEEAAPILKYSGYVSGANGECAVIETGNRGYLLRAGVMVGDYEVRSFDPDGLVLGSPSGAEFSFPLNGLLLGEAPATKLRMRFDGTPLGHAVRAIANVSNIGVHVDTALKSRVRFGGAADGLSDVLSKLVPAGGIQGKTVKLKHGDLWIVGGEKFVRSVTGALAASKHRGKKVTFDFVEAELPYVMKILAQELKVSLIMQKGLAGTVTIATPGGLPAEDLTASITAGHGLSYSLDGTTLLVGAPEWVKASGH